MRKFLRMGAFPYTVAKVQLGNDHRCVPGGALRGCNWCGTRCYLSSNWCKIETCISISWLSATVEFRVWIVDTKFENWFRQGWTL